MSRRQAVYKPLTDILPFEGMIEAPHFAVKDIHETGFEDDLWVVQHRQGDGFTYHSVVIVDESAKAGMMGVQGGGDGFQAKIVMEDGVPFPVVLIADDKGDANVA